MLLIGNNIQKHRKSSREAATSKRDLQGGTRFGILVHAYREWSDFLRVQTTYYAHCVAMLELVTGRDSLALNNPNEPVASWKDQLKNIYWVVGNFRICFGAVEYQAELGNFLERAYLDLLSLEHGDPACTPDLHGGNRSVLEAIQHYQNLMERQVKCHRSVGLLRAQAQLDAVEAVLNQQQTESSAAIAQQSEEIAEATHIDSQSMKTVASLSILYLPQPSSQQRSALCSSARGMTGPAPRSGLLDFQRGNGVGVPPYGDSVAHCESTPVAFETVCTRGTGTLRS